MLQQALLYNIFPIFVNRGYEHRKVGIRPLTTPNNPEVKWPQSDAINHASGSSLEGTSALGSLHAHVGVAIDTCIHN